MTQNIVIVPEFEDQQRQLIKETLPEYQPCITFLSPLESTERKRKLEASDILLMLNPADHLKKEEFSLLSNAQFIQLLSAGADHIPYQDIPDHIILASNTGAYAQPISEHVLAMALCLAKRLREEHRNMKKGEFNQYNKLNRSINNATVGILGFGGIGQATGRLFQAFGANIFAMNTSGETDKKVAFAGTTDDLKHILSTCNIVILSLPLNNHTRGLIDNKQLQWMKDDAILINVARGEIISQKALYEHLKDHPKFKAGLESWWVEPIRHGSFELEYPLLQLPNVLASPHNSSAVPGAINHGIKKAAENIKRYINGEPIRGEINREDFV